MAALQLDIVTPDKIVLKTQADYVEVAGLYGDMGILPGHADMLAGLKIGPLYYRINGETKWVFISGGFAQVGSDTVTILAEAAELAQDIDVGRATVAKERAEKRIAEHDEKTDMARANAALNRAIMRITIAGKR